MGGRSVEQDIGPEKELRACWLNPDLNLVGDAACQVAYPWRHSSSSHTRQQHIPRYPGRSTFYAFEKCFSNLPSRTRCKQRCFNCSTHFNTKTSMQVARYLTTRYRNQAATSSFMERASDKVSITPLLSEHPKVPLLACEPGLTSSVWDADQAPPAILVAQQKMQDQLQ